MAEADPFARSTLLAFSNMLQGSVTTTRRTMLGQTGLGGLGMLMPACSTQTQRVPSSTPIEEAAVVATYEARSLPFDAGGLPGLSRTLLGSHYQNNYLGAVKKLNGVRARLHELDPDAPGYVLHGLSQGELAFKHSVVLHEAYFGNLTGGGSEGQTARRLLSEHFGSAAAWESRFRALGLSLAGGSGWAILEFDLHEKVPRMYTAGDHTQGLSSGLPLLVLDMYEHSYHMDYGTVAAKYVDAFFANLHWEEVDRRLAKAQQVAALP